MLFAFTGVSGFGGKDAAKIMNDMSWTFYRAHAAAQAVFFVDNSTIILYLNGSGCAGSFADAAADAADLALLTGLSTFILIGAFYGDVVCTFMDMNDLLWAGTNAHAAGNAFFFINLGNTTIVDGNCTKLTNGYAGLAGEAAIAAFRVFFAGTAASVAGDQCGFIWKSFLNSHDQSFLSYGVLVIGRE